jgi:hypothetical protein
LIVVFANIDDQSARRFVRRWEALGASLMTPADLSCSGWSCNSRNPTEARFVVGGHIHAAREIDGVLVRSPTVLADELASITPTDRSYVAAEMNAFLVYWLSVLDRPVLNRPTPRCLGGPGWYPQHWIHCAASVGLQTAPMTRAITAAGFDEARWGHHSGPIVELTILGKQCFGDAEPGLVQKAHRLAQASGVGLASFRFDGRAATSRFLMADPFPSLDDEPIARAVLGYLMAPRAMP